MEVKSRSLYRPEQDAEEMTLLQVVETIGEFLKNDLYL
jgi:hypothetical protein